MTTRYKCDVAGNQLSINQIRNVHQKVISNAGFDDFYRGGRNVTSGVADNDKNDSIPTSGQIGISNFYESHGGRSTNHSITYACSYDSYIGYFYQMTSMSPNTHWNGAVITDCSMSGNLNGNRNVILSIDITGNLGQYAFEKVALEGYNWLASAATYTYQSGTNNSNWVWETAGDGPNLNLSSGTYNTTAWFYDSTGHIIY